LWLARDYNRYAERFNSPDFPPLNIMGFITEESALHGTEMLEAKVLGGDEWFAGKKDISAIIAIGSPRVRIKVVEKLSTAGLSFPILVHPSVIISEYVDIGSGTAICAGSVISTQAVLGEHVIVNRCCNISHDVELDDFVTLAPGVNICGSVTVGYAAELGASSTVIQNISIGRGALIGAGATVVDHVPANVVAKGVPASISREIPERV
jgi:sugar O-acyltransferase (sialic acid O-acetyltransferase NeuD family)